jgi:hypothetical protein
MRRFFSITVIAALVCSPLLSAAATTCAEAGRSMSCHRGHMQEQRHHCVGMEPTDDAPVTDISALSSVPDQCSMGCCDRGQTRESTYAAALNLGGFAAVILGKTQIQQVTFRSSDSSLHTDRGPPAA